MAGHNVVEEIDMITALAGEVAEEVRRAERKHEPMNSPHEGWSVIFEELEELREHIRADTGRSGAARKEAIQIAAMGIRYVLNLCTTRDADQ
jgi:NTP pyrophosphatase (non-canonical NTP hydrolase)